MAMLTVDMPDVIQRAVLSLIATVNEDGTPNLLPNASLTAGATRCSSQISPRLGPSRIFGVIRRFRSMSSISSRGAAIASTGRPASCTKPIEIVKRSPNGFGGQTAELGSRSAFQ